MNTVTITNTMVLVSLTEHLNVGGTPHPDFTKCLPPPLFLSQNVAAALSFLGTALRSRSPDASRSAVLILRARRFTPQGMVHHRLAVVGARRAHRAGHAAPLPRGRPQLERRPEGTARAAFLRLMHPCYRAASCHCDAICRGRSRRAA